MSASRSASSHGAVGIDTETLTRDRRGAEESMGVWEIAPGMFGVGTGADDYSEYVVDVDRMRCTCDDWRFRGAAGSGEIARCKHLSRIGMVLGELEPPADAEPSRELVHQRERWSA